MPSRDLDAINYPSDAGDGAVRASDFTLVEPVDATVGHAAVLGWCPPRQPRKEEMNRRSATLLQRLAAFIA
jgi:hypothetical protein